LSFPPQVNELESPDFDTIHEMHKDLQAYIQTSLEVLTARHATPVERAAAGKRTDSVAERGARPGNQRDADEPTFRR
jgi:hypothetical protein